MRRRICSLLGVLCALLFAAHGTYAGVLMMSGIPLSRFLLLLGRGLFTILILHFLLGFPFVIRRMAVGGKIYIRENRSTLLQQLSGLLLIVFAAYHSGYLSHPPTALSLVLILITLACFGLHIFLGIPKACVTLGLISEEKDMITAKRIALFFSFLPTVFSMVAFLFYFPQCYPG